MDVPQVRQRVTEAIRERGLGSPELIGETVLVQGGYYAGRRFIFDDVEAIWLVGADQISLRTNDGEMLPPILLEAGASERPAA